MVRPKISNRRSAKTDQCVLFDTIIIGAGAAGMMAAAHAGGRVLVIDHAKAAGEKIRISGGGRCNFTNIHTGPDNFISNNPHFCKSALSRYTQWDFIDLVTAHGIPYHEKTLGQLFCDTSAKDIIRMLLDEMAKSGAELRLNTAITGITHSDAGFRLTTDQGQTLQCNNLVVACGGKSIPKMGATGFGYDIARQFGLNVTETRAGLVPLTFGADTLARMKPLAGTALDASVTANGTTFQEAMLFTHRGLSGPSILQISNYWHEKQPITLNLAKEALPHLRTQRSTQGKRQIATVLADLIPKRLAQQWTETHRLQGNIGDCSDAKLSAIADTLQNWEITPIGTEGYRTAEVTLGGVDTDALNSKTMESKTVPGLYFIGEVVDVTGWLGGYNFQWAWSSGWAAGTAIAASA